MSDYTYATGTFLSKDSLPPGSILKSLQGYEFENEFSGIMVALNSKLDNTGDTWSGTLTGPTIVVDTITAATITGGTF